MASFDVTVDVDAPVQRTWDALTDWSSHGAWIPLTRVRVTSQGGRGVGAGFVGRTGVGPLAFDDPMVVQEWEPPRDGRPGRCAVRKTGRVVLGGASFTVAERPGGSRVVWHEDVEVPPVALTRRAAPLVAAGGRALFGLALRRFARRVERAAA
ncbi:SRPBCC family protein [Vallicoccus soli]|uniref:SRPBCC family protein n=1 Tax=Vallicoccus soli TaxID=2339232 RepID=UPI001C4991B2|nr:SRPBCC family protein [Vallicoccus soli]